MENTHNYFVSLFCGSRRNIFNKFLLCVHKSVKVVKTFLYVFSLQAQPTMMMIHPLGCRRDCAPREALLHQAAGATGNIEWSGNQGMTIPKSGSSKHRHVLALHVQ